MKRKRYTHEQIISILKEHEAGQPVGELAHRYGVVENMIYRWKSKYGGMEISDAKRLRDLEHEDPRLKRLLAEHYPRYGYLTLHEMLKQEGRVNPPT